MLKTRTALQETPSWLGGETPQPGSWEPQGRCPRLSSVLPTLKPPTSRALAGGLAHSLSAVVHAVPRTQLGCGVEQSQLGFRNLDLAQFLQHLHSLGKETSALDIRQDDPLIGQEARLSIRFWPREQLVFLT